ncbi:MAG: hypothetical protein QNI99_21360 [Woeseiaceae bacterium]|nr:hypothetical protein [Woeseiaceae bacterium]
MDAGYSIEERGDVTVISLLRTLTKQEILGIIDVIASLGRREKRLWILGDHVRLTAEEMSEIGNYGREKIEGPSRVAYVAGDDLTFGLTNIQAAYRDVGGFEDQLFRDEASAMAWLNEQASSPPRD